MKKSPSKTNFIPNQWKKFLPNYTIIRTYTIIRQVRVCNSYNRICTRYLPVCQNNHWSSHFLNVRWLKDHSTTTWTKFYPILTTYPPIRWTIVDILYTTYPLFTWPNMDFLLTTYLTFLHSYWKTPKDMCKQGE